MNKRLKLILIIFAGVTVALVIFFIIINIYRHPIYCESSYYHDEYQKYYCYTYWALELEDSSYCEKKSITNYSDDCYYKFATNKSEPQYCNKINRERTKSNCYSYFAIRNQDSSYCEKKSITNYSDDCYYKFATNKSEPQYCDEINDIATKNRCYSYFAVKNQDFSYCEKIDEDSKEQESCKKKVNFLLYINENSLKDTEGKNPEFVESFNKSVMCNSYFIIYNAVDICYDYHRISSQWRYCRSDSKPCYDWYTGSFKRSWVNQQLSQTEASEICDNLVHPGIVADCKRYVEGKESCLSYADENEYLKAICNLEEGEYLDAYEFPPRDMNFEI